MNVLGLMAGALVTALALGGCSSGSKSTGASAVNTGGNDSSGGSGTGEDLQATGGSAITPPGSGGAAAPAEAPRPGLGGSGAANAPSPQEPFSKQARVIFLHHSTGGMIWNGGVHDWFRQHNASQATAYDVTELAYPHDPYPWKNYPYDYWRLWVQGAGPSPVEGQETLEMLTARYDVIVFKHCFPVSGIDPDDGAPSVSSEAKTLGNYKLQYQALRDKLLTFPRHRFLLWTGAALSRANSSAEAAARARSFFTWVKSEWDRPGDNIFIWDLFELETRGGDYLLDEYAAQNGADSHPNEAFTKLAAPLFAQRLVDVIEGRGDTGSLTGK